MPVSYYYYDKTLKQVMGNINKDDQYYVYNKGRYIEISRHTFMHYYNIGRHIGYNNMIKLIESEQV